MTTDVDHLPPFTPIPARPASPLAPEDPFDQRTLKKPRKAKKSAAKKAVPVKKAPAKKAKPAKKPRKAKAAVVPIEPTKRVRSSRVAPLMLDAAAMLSTLAGLGKTEALTMRNIVEMLNPLARPARKRVLNAVLALMGN